ncbi:MAG: hypothetical protein U9O98_01380 [Asgard group archaeon]|nr:hypothetical protein [Asgard group archaeon]
MSQNIDKVKVQIPGTMYQLQLTADRGRWILALLLRGSVEKEVVVPVFSENGIQKAANEILNDSRLVIDKYPLRNVCEQLYNAAETSLPMSKTEEEEKEVTHPNQLAEFEQKLDYLENTLENLSEELKENMDDFTERIKNLETERVARLENELEQRKDDIEESMLSDLSDRISQLEELTVSSKGDERVPSILTALEALESKISQIEGQAVTQQTESEESPSSIQGLKAEIGKIAQAFDSINQRLTNLEKKFEEAVHQQEEEEKQPIEGAEF